ncbi:MAG TPA: cation:proton antiporter [Gemmatimonadales bacterium]|nr:cation:proton antiporter [Gemmatimonadales bacterium]
MTHETFAATLAMIGIVIVVSSLLSGVVERTGLPQVAIFLLLGAALGPAGLGLVELTLHSPSLEVIATLGLVLVLFSDAIGVDIGEIRLQRRLALLILVPGTLLPAMLIAAAAWWLLDLAPAAAAILGAALASTDPVLLRNLLRNPALTGSAKLGLRIESGMNDVILLPIVVLCMLVLRPGTGTPAWEIGSRSVGLFLLGPMLGVFVGWVAITMLDQVRRRIGVRRDYESLYALGVAFTAFAAAEAVGGSGFLAAFAAGLVIAALDVELCDCFLDYGEASAEMFLLLTFVAFGAGLIWTGFRVAGDWRVWVFAAVALTIRTAVLMGVLKRSGIDDQSRRLIALFGPRGLSSLLLVLLPVFAGVPGSEALFVVTCFVVLLSVALHGGGIAAYLQRAARSADAGPVATGGPSPRGTRAAEPPATVATRPSLADTAAHLTPLPAGSRAREAAGAPGSSGAAAQGGDVPERITIAEFRDLHRSGEPILVLDVRTERSYRDDPHIGVGAIRLPPDDAVRLARERRLDRDATLVLYCA